ncbi:hypothetical protein ILUMI_15681 [Ignelater luminosus]|uniref:Uncharacterized protein n=1 Tax=Ignelater luminosus TaxID=2038154 RepID=A0A8K0CSF2_IGNLU|nr:hypothetical protein ILUMI_15681 [Ignelater luminosus]
MTEVVSDRSASLIVNAVLKDLGLVSTTHPSKIFDRRKITRARKKRRTDLIDMEMETKDFIISGIHFDGKRDKTLALEKTECTHHENYYGREEHIVITAEPEFRYLGHVSPTSGNANSISSSILSLLKDIPGENFNNICILEKPIQWFICLLPTNELPLRCLIHQLDRKTMDPKGFIGITKKLLDECEQMPAELPSVDLDGLSDDRKHICELALFSIPKCRNSHTVNNGIRELKVPNINFED